MRGIARITARGGVRPSESAHTPQDFQRFTIVFLAFLLLPALMVVALVVVVDPYYLVGSPSWRGINVVRPFYEFHVLEVKPYQVRRIKPDAVTLGSSAAEVGLDPRHLGWRDQRVFNFGLPSASSYEVMLAFTNAQAIGRPLKQAVVGLDFFAYNIFKSLDERNAEGRFAGSGADEFADFLSAEIAGRPRTQGGKAPASTASIARTTQPSIQAAGESDALPWNEALYRAVHPDVAAAIARGEFKSGRQHYELAGRAEGRKGGTIPSSWNEALYLKMYPDVAAAVARGTFLSGYHHYLVNGRAEGREGTIPDNWNEALYLKMYPDVAAEVARGTFVSGFHHYLAAGRAEGREGTIPANWNEALYLKMHPDVAAEIKRGTFVNGFHHYLAAGRAEGREGGLPPANWDEARYLRMHPDVQNEVTRGTFLNGLHHYLLAGRAEGRDIGVPPANWDDALYLRLYPDVQAEVKRGTFFNGYSHYVAAGRAEGRQSGAVPLDWDEATYLDVNRDVEYQVSQGLFQSGYHHYLVAGRAEKRLGGYPPAGWNEAQYLAANPAARVRIALGDYRSGYAHYASVGKSRGLQGGFAPANALERLRARWPRFNQWLFQFDERFRLIFSATAVHDSVFTILRQSEGPVFDDRGMRVWEDGHSTGVPYRDYILNSSWYLWLRPPHYQYCFTNTDSGMTMFDPYRFMLRRAYAEGTDLRLFVTPTNAAARTLIDALGLGEHYQAWLRELVRINEEEAARAKKVPLPLWDFSDPNEITREPVPLSPDPPPMKYFWEYSHFRRVAGDLILDRVLGHSDPKLPADFGTRLTGPTINAHLLRTQAKLAEWAAANSELAARIVAAARDPKAQNRQAQATCW